MQYLGGKAKIARRLVAFLNQHRKPGQLYVEPFLGGCNILPLMANPRVGADANESVMLCYQAIRDGWYPPEHVSEEEYAVLQQAGPSRERGFAGVGCSYSGKWFGGYARDRNGRNYASNARNWALKVRPLLVGAELRCADYRHLPISDGSLVYCDPPYAGVTKYKETSFCHDEFWPWVRELSARCDVFVSEYQAPPDFECVWELERDFGMKEQHKSGKARRVERIFKYLPR